ncbi:hypothetical protein QEH56_06895 [Pelagicoccus enzymogenes]|uniref:hypothetical protein n=1 Tax=Pelagicoccus enzymogenes TaxID=2773457 RepID=UPI00280C9C1F|nr:hypothetical protein [Pelagicoccus enzymogenes]MDQ8197866.1 hypothetical protein [Pelagicoccus enzymogenes]
MKKWLLLFLITGVSVASARPRDLAKVYVASEAIAEYEERRMSPEGLVPESYHIMKGRFYGGIQKDGSLDETSFETLAEALKMELVKRQYYPAREFKQGDLLLVVHWGATEPPSDDEEDFGADDPEDTELAADDTFASEAPLETIENWNESTSLTQRPIDERILGFDKAADDNSLSLVEREMLLSQYYTERYFFIIMAYDWQLKMKTGETKLLWTTRFSLESTGTNFVDSFPALFRGASDYFGTDLEGMARSVTNFGEGEVSMGELEVLESAKDEKDID